MRARATSAHRALLLRRSPLGENEEIVTLLTDGLGLVRAVGKRARPTPTRSRPGHATLLDPFHTLSVDLSFGAGDLGRLASSSIERARLVIPTDGNALDAAGAACRQVRALLPPHVAEPLIFEAIEQLFDTLDAAPLEAPVLDAAVCRFDFALLEVIGASPELGRCVVCGRARPSGRSAVVDARKGGVVCADCRDARREPRAPIVETLPAALLDHLDALDASKPSLSALSAWLRAMIDDRVAAVAAAPRPDAR